MNLRSLSVVASPAVAVMNRLTYGRKFILIVLALLIPFSYTVYLQFQGTSKDIDFNAKERVGIAYIIPARDLLRSLEQQRIVVVAEHVGTAGMGDKVNNGVAEIERMVAAVDAADKAYGAEMKSTAKWGEIKAEWGGLRGRKFGSATEADAAYAAVTAQVVDLILNYAANYSNLILDPDLDSYWLMDLWVAKLPTLGQTTAALTTRALLPAAGDDQGRTIALAGSYSTLTALASDAVNVNLATTFKETKDAGVKPALENAGNQTLGALNDFAAYVRRDHFVDGNTAGAVALVDRAIAALNQVYDMYARTGPELDRLCAVRVEKYKSDRSSGLIAATIATLVLAYLLVGFYLSVRRSVSQLADATRRMIAGTTEKIALDARDEVGAIAVEYNQINTALVEARTLKNQVENDNRELQANVVDLLTVVSEASDGNLTVRANIGAGALGNVGDAFNQLLESLTALLKDVHIQIDRTNDVVAKIRVASEEMTVGANKQAAELVSATALVENVSSSIVNVSEIAVQASEAAQRAKESAESGAENVQNVVTGMQALRTNVQAGAKKMKNLGERSMEITSIVNTIQRISEQTNMLALNAAIEAARAGEHGRGFTVVADEVRKLAERAAGATEEIGKLVRTIHAETTETVQAIEAQTLVVEEEATVVSSAGESLGQILEVSNESFDLVANIRTVAGEQVAGTQKVQSRIAQISEIAAHTQKGAEQNLSIIANLVQQSNQLTESMRRFRV